MEVGNKTQEEVEALVKKLKTLKTDPRYAKDKDYKLKIDTVISTLRNRSKLSVRWKKRVEAQGTANALIRGWMRGDFDDDDFIATYSVLGGKICQ